MTTMQTKKMTPDMLLLPLVFFGAIVVMGILAFASSYVESRRASNGCNPVLVHVDLIGAEGLELDIRGCIEQPQPEAPHDGEAESGNFGEMA